MNTPISPLGDVPTDPLLASLPKIDLHCHAEAYPRLDRLLAPREGRQRYDWRDWLARMMPQVPPGISRLDVFGNGELDIAALAPFDEEPENVIERIQAILEEAAADGAVLVEVVFGALTVFIPDFMALFREGERRAQTRYPSICGEANIALRFSRLSDEQCEACLRLARDGLAGVNFLPEPYAEEADWAAAYAWARRFAGSGLGVTAHAGEFSVANIAAALTTPGLTRIGHGTNAASNPDLVRRMANSGVNVECCLTCNVVLGSVLSYEEHPVHTFSKAGINVSLNTDDPVRVCTTIGREYAIANRLGFSLAELALISRRAIEASFATPERKQSLLASLNDWEAVNLG